MLYEIGRPLCRAFVKIAYKCTFEGLENIPDGGFILCSNHRSYMDPVLLGLRVKPHLNFMAKKELFKPGFGWLIRHLGAFPVERGNGGEAIEKAIQTVEDGKVFAIFPEGTRAKDGVLGRGKTGVALIAAKTGADIVPAAVGFEGKLHFRSRVTVRFGKPIHASELGVVNDTPGELKAASTLLMTRVAELLEQDWPGKGFTKRYLPDASVQDKA